MLSIISAGERLEERHSANIALVGQPRVGKTSQLRTRPADTPRRLRRQLAMRVRLRALLLSTRT